MSLFHLRYMHLNPYRCAVFTISSFSSRLSFNGKVSCSGHKCGIMKSLLVDVLCKVLVVISIKSHLKVSYSGHSCCQKVSCSGQYIISVRSILKNFVSFDWSSYYRPVSREMLKKKSIEKSSSDKYKNTHLFVFARA